MSGQRKIKFIVNVSKWFDRINGNTYHSVRITRCRDGQVIGSLHPPYEYGYGEQYRDTALDAMEHEKWIPPKYRGRRENGSRLSTLYERENGYPIVWQVSDGLKRDMVANGTV